MPLLNSGIWSYLSLHGEGLDALIISHVNGCRAVVLSSILALAACQTLPDSAAPGNGAAITNVKATHSGQRYRIDTQASQIRLLVYRDGPMARVGHNHVMAGPVTGDIYVSDTAAASGFRIEIPVESLQVDAPALRVEEGVEFAAALSEQARKGTRDNMLGAEVLDAVHHPQIVIESDALSGPRWNPDVSALITVRGKTSTLKFPAAVFEQAGELTVIAAFTVLQTELGMTPYSILGGAVTVRNAIDIRVRLVARPAAE